MPDHGGTPAPWSESEIDALVDFIADQEAPVEDGAAWMRDSRSDDTYEGTRSGSQEVLVVNLGDRPGYLDADEELMDRFTLLPPTNDTPHGKDEH